MRNQIQRAAGFVMHNIAKGFESGYAPEFIRFLKMARRSAGEVQSEFYLSLDAQYIIPEEFQKGYYLAPESKKIINGLITYLVKRKSTRKLSD